MRKIVAPFVVLLVVVLSACTPKPVDMTVDLGTVQLEVVVPGGNEDGDHTISGLPCSQAAASVWTAQAFEQVTFALVTPDTACPDTEPLNGGFPSWSEAASLPADATPFEGPTGFEDAHRFELEYTECTNDCKHWQVQIAVLGLADGGAVQVIGMNLAAEDFDEIVETVALA